MNDSLSVIIAFIAIIVFTLAVGYSLGISDTRDKAAKAGAGEYVIDPVTGVKDFKWITIKNKE